MLDRGLRFVAATSGITFALASACTGPERLFFDDSGTGGLGAGASGGSNSGKGGSNSGKGGSNSGKGGGGGTSAGGDTGAAASGGDMGSAASGGDPGSGASGGDPGSGATGGDPGSGATGGDPGSGATGGDPGAAAAGGTPGAAGSGGGVVPSVVVSSASVSQNGTTSKSAASFDFSDNPPGSADGYECRLDGAATFSNCTSGFDVDLLQGGLHKLYVRAFNENGTGPILERDWVVEAMGTTISAIQMGSVPVDTLVTVSTNVRVTWFTTFDSFTVFVQEANYVSTLADVAYKGVMTNPRAAEANMQAGLEVSVTGSVKERSGNTVIDAATYARGAQSAAYNPAFFDEPSDLKLEQYEGVWAQTHGHFPGFNCSSGCLMPNPIVCIHGCGACDMLGYRDVGGFAPADDGWFVGPLVGTAVGIFELWIQEYQDASDACL